jgi:hypothetical protein
VRTGDVWYRNFANSSSPGSNATSDSWVEWEGEYEIREHGVKNSDVLLGTDESGPFIGRGRGKLRLELYEPGLYFSSTGEALDLRQTPPTFRNIRLLKKADRRRKLTGKEV